MKERHKKLLEEFVSKLKSKKLINEINFNHSAEIVFIDDLPSHWKSFGYIEISFS